MSWASQTYDSVSNLGTPDPSAIAGKATNLASDGQLGIMNGFNSMQSHLYGNDPWGFARQVGIGGGMALLTGGMVGGPFSPMIAGVAGGLAGKTYGAWQKRDRQLKDQRNYHAMAVRNRDLASAGAGGITGSVATAQTGQDVSSVMSQYAQARAAAMQAYEAQIMDQFSMFGEMAGVGAGSSPNPYGNQG